MDSTNMLSVVVKQEQLGTWAILVRLDVPGHHLDYELGGFSLVYAQEIAEIISRAYLVGCAQRSVGGR